ncbi:MAG: hypothetical protein M1834_007071 [Cirrosporium novae-zelandiae]|nr:MAG: hypothetical protein M1834_007071 [Cirrosporium novae-zelandiae]
MSGSSAPAKRAIVFTFDEAWYYYPDLEYLAENEWENVTHVSVGLLRAIMTVVNFAEWGTHWIVHSVKCGWCEGEAQTLLYIVILTTTDSTE